MILNLGADISVESTDIVAIVDLTRGQKPLTGTLLREARRRGRVLAGQEIEPRSAVLCQDARRPGGVMENGRLYLSPVAAGRLAARAHGHRARLQKAAAGITESEEQE